MTLARLKVCLKLDWVQRCVLCMLGLCALASVGVGLHNALHQSQDFQWSPERLLLQHIDPWREYLRGDPNHRFIDSQFPNYLPPLYVLIAPLGMLAQTPAKLLWGLCNVSFAALSGWTLGRVFGLDVRLKLATLFLVLMATPIRSAIGNGQQCLLVLLLWCLSLLPTNKGAASSLLLGCTYFKFSFSPAVALFLALRSGIRGVLWSIVPWVGSAIGVWLWLGAAGRPASLVRFALEPFVVASTGFRRMPGDPNLMAVLEDLFPSVPREVSQQVAGMLVLSVCLIVAYLAFCHSRGRALVWQMSVMATMSYVLFEHHPYDAVVLMIPFAYALAHWRERKAKWVLVLSGYFFYAERALEALRLRPWWIQYGDCALLLCLLGLTYAMEGSLLPEMDQQEQQLVLGMVHGSSRSAERAA